MKALEARTITEQNQLSLTDALKMIEGEAKRGGKMCMFHNLHADTFTRLLGLGYKISKHTDPMGLEVDRIEW